MKFEKKDTVQVDGVTYQKTRLFGNRNFCIKHKNKKAYDRKAFKRQQND